MFKDVRAEITRKFLDIKNWIEEIVVDTKNINDNQATSRGLFFVYIYGVYEAIIHHIITSTITELNNSGIASNSCIYELTALLFSNEYDSIYGAGEKTKWEKRWAISDKMKINQPIQISEVLFPTDGKNIRIGQLESLKRTFGIVEPIIPRQEIQGYIHEMVEFRNYIAHGDELPKDVGKRFTKQDILKRHLIIQDECNYLCDLFEDYIVNKKYVRR